MKPENTLGDAQRALARRLREAGFDTADLDARLLTAHAAGLDAAALIMAEHDLLSPDAALRLEAAAAARLAHRPVSKIIGRRGFWGHQFIVTDDVLDPRPDSETVVEVALDRLPDKRPLQLLDLGTGSGCLLLSLLAERPLATGLGIDASAAALDVAQANAAVLVPDGRASFACGNWFDACAGRFDLIVSNPPYIAETEAAGLSRDVRAHDPAMALFGGPDGLSAYRTLIAGAPLHLEVGGWLILEIGHQQATAVAKLLDDAGFATPLLFQDLGGRDRVLAARKTES